MENKPRQGPPLFEKIIGGNFLAITFTILMGFTIGHFATSKRIAVQPSEDSMTVVGLPSAAQRPNQEPTPSTHEEKHRILSEGNTPEFVKTHVAALSKHIDSQIVNGELSLKNLKDSQEIAKIQQRISQAKKFREKLARVNPNDASTWFWIPKS